MNREKIVSCIEDEITLGNYDKASQLLYVYEKMSEHDMISIDDLVDTNKLIEDLNKETEYFKNGVEDENKIIELYSQAKFLEEINIQLVTKIAHCNHILIKIKGDIIKADEAAITCISLEEILEDLDMAIKIL